MASGRRGGGGGGARQAGVVRNGGKGEGHVYVEVRLMVWVGTRAGRIAASEK